MVSHPVFGTCKVALDVLSKLLSDVISFILTLPVCVIRELGVAVPAFLVSSPFIITNHMRIIVCKTYPNFLTKSAFQLEKNFSFEYEYNEKENTDEYVVQIQNPFNSFIRAEC